MINKCKKVSYSSEKFAMQDVKRFSFIDDGRDKPIRAYKCVLCKTYHLTKSLDYVSSIHLLKNENETLTNEVNFLKEKTKDMHWFQKWKDVHSKYLELLKKLKEETLYKLQNDRLIALKKEVKKLQNEKSQLISRLNSNKT